MLDKSGESGHPCLVPDLRKSAFSFSPLSMMLALFLSYMAFIMLRYAHFLESFTIDAWEILSKTFLHLLRCIWFLFFNLLMCHLDLFADI